jgi:hypothetical protein
MAKANLDIEARREKILFVAAVVTPGLLQANGMQPMDYQAHLSVELALAIEQEVQKQLPVPAEDPAVTVAADADTAK